MARFHNQKASMNGTGAPTSVTPEFIGQIYVDSDGPNYYYSTGTDEGDWSLVSEPEIHALNGVEHEGSGGAEDNFATFDANGKLKDGGYNPTSFQEALADWKPKVFAAAGEPTLTGTRTLAIWKSTSDSNRIFLITKRTDNTQMLVELT